MSPDEDTPGYLRPRGGITAGSLDPLEQPE
jgi:hypothetical protein